MNNPIISKLALPNDQWISIAKGLGIAVAGAAVTYLSQHLADIDFGQYNYVIIPLATVALNILRKVVLHEPGNIIGSMSVDEAKCPGCGEPQGVFCRCGEFRS